MQIPKHLSPEFISLRLGSGPGIYSCVCLMQVIRKRKGRNDAAKESLMILSEKDLRLVLGSPPYQLCVLEQITFSLWPQCSYLYSKKVKMRVLTSQEKNEREKENGP